MNTQLLHTPEGVRDIYNGECVQKQVLQERIRTILTRYGYQTIETPTFEFFDVFRHGGSSNSVRELYKFFDREGNIVVLRPDFTPSIARVCATALADAALPIRLCYTGNTFYNHSSYRGELHEETELGAELIGDSSVEADAEMIAMIVDCMEALGVSDYQVSIGQNDFFKSIVEEAGLDDDTEESLRELILNHNLFGVEQVIEAKDVSAVVKSVFRKLPELFGGPEILEEAYRLTINEHGKNAVNRVRRLYELLKLHKVDEHVTFDFSMLGKYDYYTGVTFRVYTYGTGDAVIKGGRYDNLLGKFGKDEPAIGFAVMADELLNAMKQQKIALPAEVKKTLLMYREEEEKEAILLARGLRKNGQNIEMLKLSSETEATEARDRTSQTGVNDMLLMEGNGRVKLFSLGKAKEEEYDLSLFLKEDA